MEVKIKRWMYVLVARLPWSLSIGLMSLSTKLLSQVFIYSLVVYYTPDNSCAIACRSQTTAKIKK